MLILSSIFCSFIEVFTLLVPDSVWLSFVAKFWSSILLFIFVVFFIHFDLLLDIGGSKQ